MEEVKTPAGYSRPVKIAVPVLAIIIAVIWLINTPGGLLGKADAVGYAVCHRIPTHSHFMADRQMPLCARCSGMHLGSLLGLVFLLRSGKKGGMPSPKVLIALGVFLLAFAVDGANSYVMLGQETGNALPLLANIPALYEPQNWLRTLTGLLLGLGISAVLYPVFNQTMWKDWNPEPVLASWKQLFLLVGLALVLEAAILSNNVLILLPLAILSALNVLIVLSMIYAIVWAMIIKKENQFKRLSQTWVLLVAGFTTAVLQIGIMDYGRYWLTGTWDGFLF